MNVGILKWWKWERRFTNVAASDDMPVTEKLENEQEEREIENSEFTGSECNETSDWMDSNDTYHHCKWYY